MQRETMEYDVVVVGAGPAGLSAAIRLRQLKLDMRVCVVEKGSEVGAHILSGAVFDPKALNALIPDWKEKGAPLNTLVAKDRFTFLTGKMALPLPVPPAMNNHGCYVISLANLCRWLARQAEALGVEIFPGFPATDIVMEQGRLVGVVTGDFGVGRSGEHKGAYQPGVIIRASHVILGEGCRGSLSERVIKQFSLRSNSDPQTYGLGIKEIWEVAAPQHKMGMVQHTIGWPMDSATYGGSFIYHFENNQVAIGFITGLDYANPYLNPYEEFQRFKMHPVIRPILEGGRRVAYGARALNEGGLQSLPALTFPGGVLLGCSAGFLNVARIKGSHLAMMSGMLAAEAIAEGNADSYSAKVRASWIHEELHRARNIRPGFHKWGLWGGMANAALESYIKTPWTLRCGVPDHDSLKQAVECKPITYPKHDGVVSFDLMSSVYLSNTNHEEDQPCHLTLKDASVPERVNLPLYAGPESRYCPAGVYEYVENKLKINAQNCVHCKTCDIKDPTQNIVWVTPEGGGGPNYGGM